MTGRLVLVPGVGGGPWLWQHQLDHLSDLVRTEVLVLDEQATRAEMAQYVLDRVTGTFSLAGHSLGGWVAQEVAARAPDRVEKLFLCDTWTRSAPGTVESLDRYRRHLERDRDGALEAHFDRLLAPGRYTDREFCRRLRAWQRRMPVSGYVRQLRALARDHPTVELLPRIAADTLVVRGRHDRVVHPDEAPLLASSVHRAALALIEDAGHCTPIEQPQALTAVMRLWRTRGPAGGAAAGEPTAKPAGG
ncbi:alpha/beta fold hydrolase, partial [Streptomyces erythrochromogenes]|uniref:alpha/beta fold hydrolase n=1 Tax=Streptomyces erythrochromogenes TaxID=285574 RepID=UPI0036ADC176